MSSSAISTVYILGPTGNLGPVGPTGNVGRTGSTGSTGNTGPQSSYYSAFLTTNSELILYLNDGTTFSVFGNFRGATTIDQTGSAITGANLSGVSLFSYVNGGTFYIRGISAYGSLRASLTGPNKEYISIDTIYWGNDVVGNYLGASMTPKKIVYLGDVFTVYGATLGYSTEHTDQGWKNPLDFYQSTTKEVYHLNAGTRTSTLGPISRNAYSGFTQTAPLNGVGTTLGIFLDANGAGAFILRTPIGIQGITGTFNKGEITSITLLFDSDNVWTFPQNIYFDPRENYLSCGRNILGLFTYDGGDTWIANVSHRGHGIETARRQCIPGNLWGSCCYTKSDGTLACLDYTDKINCDRKFGEFNPGVPCEKACGSDISICCSGNGECISDISVSLCEKYGGSYWRNLQCSAFSTSEGENYADPVETGRFCYDPCQEYDTFCCKDGQCLGKYTRVQCETVLGGIGITADYGSTCEDIDCCTLETIRGACCLCDFTAYINQTGPITSTCDNFIPKSFCIEAGGFFMGPNKLCNEVSCGCVCQDPGNPGRPPRPGQTGACCIPTGTPPGTTCVQLNFNGCSAAGGTYLGPGVSCGCVNCGTLQYVANPGCCGGACCIDNFTSDYDITQDNTIYDICIFANSPEHCTLTAEQAGSDNSIFHPGKQCYDNGEYLCNEEDICATDPAPWWCGGGPENPWGCCCVEIPDSGGRRIGYPGTKDTCSGSFTPYSLCSDSICPPGPPPCPPDDPLCGIDPTKGPCQGENPPEWCEICQNNPDLCTTCGICPECWGCVCPPKLGMVACCGCQNGSCTPMTIQQASVSCRGPNQRVIQTCPSGQGPGGPGTIQGCSCENGFEPPYNLPCFGGPVGS